MSRMQLKKQTLSREKVLKTDVWGIWKEQLAVNKGDG